jgi:hypothetical protein
VAASRYCRGPTAVGQQQRRSECRWREKLVSHAGPRTRLANRMLRAAEAGEQRLSSGSESTMTRAHFRLLMVVVVLCLFGVGLPFYVIHLQDAVGVRSGTLTFWLTIRSPVVRDFPVVCATSKPEYFYKNGLRPSSGITYRSSANREAILRETRSFVKRHGYDDGELVIPDMFTFCRNRDVLDIALSTLPEGGTLVQVIEIR